MSVMLSGRPHKKTDNVAGAERAPASSGRTAFHIKTEMRTSRKNEFGFVLNPNIRIEYSIRIHNETKFIGGTSAFPSPDIRSTLSGRPSGFVMKRV